MFSFARGPTPTWVSQGVRCHPCPPPLSLASRDAKAELGAQSLVADHPMQVFKGPIPGAHGGGGPANSPLASKVGGTGRGRKKPSRGSPSMNLSGGHLWVCLLWGLSNGHLWVNQIPEPPLQACERAGGQSYSVSSTLFSSPFYWPIFY